MKIAVGSKNPLKIEAVKEALGFDVVYTNIKPSINHTPLSIKEMEKGAKERAIKSFNQLFPVSFAVGIEGGLYKRKRWYITAITAIWDGEIFAIGQGFSVAFPSKLVEEVKKGTELGTLIEELSKGKETKEKGGAVSFITKGFLTRKELITCSVKAAYGSYLSIKNKNK